MYRLLIVDDEPYIVDSLFNYFQSVQHLELDVYKAYSAVEALDLFNSVKFDIVITDINMPEMNGIDLMKTIKSIWSACHVIFLTGYSEFEYVHTAIKYEGVKYILKYEKREELLLVVENAITEIDSLVDINNLREKAKKQNEVVLPYLQQQFMLDILNGDIQLNNKNLTLFSEYKIPISPENPLMLVMINITQAKEEDEILHKTQTYNTVYLVANEHIKSVFRMFQVVCEPSILLWILQPLQEETNTNYNIQQSGTIKWSKASVYLNQSIESIQNMCDRKIRITASYLIDSQKGTINTIQERFSYLKQLLFYYVGTNSEMKIINVGQLYAYKQSFKTKDDYQTTFLTDQTSLTRLERLFQFGNREKTLNLLIQLTEDIEKHNSMHHPLALETYFRIAISMYSCINRHGMMEKIAFKVPLYKLFSLEHFKSWEDAVRYLKVLADAIFDVKSSEQDNRLTCIIEKITQFVNEHISEDLSLTRLAKIMNFNPSYLSRIFKQETGLNLITYINGTRIEKAKELLEFSNLKIIEIAEKVGCTSPSYFTQFFKREVGMSPNEYRDRH